MPAFSTVLQKEEFQDSDSFKDFENPNSFLSGFDFLETCSFLCFGKSDCGFQKTDSGFPIGSPKFRFEVRIEVPANGVAGFGTVTKGQPPGGSTHSIHSKE